MLGYFVVMSTTAFLPLRTMIFGLEKTWAPSICSKALMTTPKSETESWPPKPAVRR